MTTPSTRGFLIATWFLIVSLWALLCWYVTANWWVAALLLAVSYGVVIAIVFVGMLLVTLVGIWWGKWRKEKSEKKYFDA